MARDLLDDIIAGLRKLAIAAPAGRPAGYGAEALSQIPWEQVLERCAAGGNPLAQQAVKDLRETVASQDSRAAPSVDELCAALVSMRAQIDNLIDSQQGALSVARTMRILEFVAKIAAAVAVGLLAAAASAAPEGIPIAAGLLPAAVGAAVTALCSRLGEAARAALRPPARGARMQTAHSELVYMLEDLAVFMGRLAESSPGQDHDLALVRDTALAATLTSFYAQQLAQTLDWSSRTDYTRELGDVRELLADAAQVAAGAVTSSDLSGQFRLAARKLFGRFIPGDLEPLPNAPGRLPRLTV